MKKEKWFSFIRKSHKNMPNDIQSLSKSIQFFEASIHFWNVVLVVAAVLTVVAAILAATGVFFVNQKTTKSDQLKARRDYLEKSDSDERIAFAKAEAAKANEGLIKSNLEIAKAKEETEKAKARIREAEARVAEANLKAQNAIAAAADANTKQEKLRIETHIKQKELTESQIQLTKADKELADAQRKQAEAELALRKKVDEVREHQKPRKLTSRQITTLLQFFKDKPKGIISMMCVGSDKESCDYALQIEKVLKTANWTIKNNAAAQFAELPTGLLLYISNPNEPPVSALILQQAFQTINVSASAVIKPQRIDKDVLLIVGIKENKY